MPIIAVVRPGCTDFDVQNRIQGNLDLPLNEDGRSQLANSISQLAAWPLKTVYTAATDPARSTAEAIGDALQLPVRFHDELANIDHGLWQGLSLKEIKRKSPKVLKQWQESPETVRPPGGETIQEALARILAVLKKPMKREESLAIVTSDPLATLLGCAITSARPEFESVTGCRGPNQLISIYSTNGSVPEADPDHPWRTQVATGSLVPIADDNRSEQRG
tara:strand:- start:5255 stop:5914 length:660 start_codon:yes stop_codon:yes gene_type:complete